MDSDLEYEDPVKDVVGCGLCICRFVFEKHAFGRRRTPEERVDKGSRKPRQG